MTPQKKKEGLNTHRTDLPINLMVGESVQAVVPNPVSASCRDPKHLMSCSMIRLSNCTTTRHRVKSAWRSDTTGALVHEIISFAGMLSLVCFGFD